MFKLSRVDLAVAVLSFVLFYTLYLFKRRSYIRILRGPPSPSYLLGLEHELRLSKTTDVLNRWTKEYGTAYRMAGCFGENILVVSDPRAIHRVFSESLQDYPEAPDIRRFFEFIFGRGVLWVTGEDHKRHRRVLSPAFSINHMRTFLPMFQGHVNHLSEKWNEALQGKSQVIDIIPWFHKLTLDVIGESAFNYHFDALDNKPNELTQTLYELEKLGLKPSSLMTLVQAVPRYIPASVAAFQAKYLPSFAEAIAKRYLELSNEKARDVMREAGLDLTGNGETDEVPIGGGTNDILSILVRANREEDPRKRLSEGELLAQMTTLIQAGHHTSGYSVSWILYELAAHPEDQAKVYQQIRRLREQNPGEFTSSDYDSLTHLTLVLKEALRLHPVVVTLEREALKNDILLLDFPVVSVDGKTIDAVPVRKGQRIKVDISSYNRLENVWGEDANSWNPERFLANGSDTKAQTQVGLFANILTFSGGPKGCLGWRFAVMEMQAIMTGLLEQYEFSIPPDVEIETGNPGLAVPSVKGRKMDGAQLPLKVTPRSVN